MEHYLVLGFDGAGNPFCIDERDGRIVLLEHELLFDVKRRARLIQFVNSGLPQFAESLLAFQRCPPDECLKALQEIDPPASNKRTFWNCECSAAAYKPPGTLARILFLRIGGAGTNDTFWVWVVGWVAAGVVLAIILNKLLKR